MTLTPLSIRKAQFPSRMRGYDPSDVDDFLQLVAEELGRVLAELEAARREGQRLRQRLDESEERERRLQDTLLKAQHLSDEIVAGAQREAQLLVREAEMTSDKIVTQAMEQAAHIESRIADLRGRRRELQLKFRNTLELFGEMLQGDVDEERATATLHRLPRKEGAEG